MSGETGGQPLTITVPDDLVRRVVAESAKTWIDSNRDSLTNLLRDEQRLLSDKLRSFEDEANEWRDQISEKRDAVDKKIESLEERLEKKAGKIVPIGVLVLAVLALGIWGAFETRLKELKEKVAAAEGSVLTLQTTATDLQRRLGPIKSEVDTLDLQRTQLQNKITAINGAIPEAARLSTDIDELCKRLKIIEARLKVKSRNTVCP